MSDAIPFETTTLETYGYAFGPKLDTFRGVLYANTWGNTARYVNPVPMSVCRHLHKSPESAIDCAKNLQSGQTS